MPVSEAALETLVRVKNEMEASIIISKLAEAEIDASATGTFTAGFLAEAPGDVSILVRSDDLTQAREVLEISSDEPVPTNIQPVRWGPILLIIAIPVLLVAILISYFN